MAGDIYYPNVSLLLHCDGPDGSTTFTDSSPTPKTVTVAGNAHIETDQKQLGTASGAFDGSGDYLTIPDSADFAFGAGDFTIEGWIYESVRGAIRQIIGQHGTASVTNSSFLILSDQGKLSFAVNYGSSTATAAYASTHTTSAWHHFAAVRDGTTLRLFLDGTSVATASIGTNTLNNSTRPVCVGVVINDTTPDPGNYYFNGYMDELRITKGVARYTADFTPPTAAFPNYAGQLSGEVRDVNNSLLANTVVRAYRRDTGAMLVSGLSGDGTAEVLGDEYYSAVALLLHCDGTDGSTTFTDSSQTPKTVTSHGNAHVETDQAKFGTAAAYFDGTGDYLSLTGVSFGTGDFTVEGWVRITTPSSVFTILDTRNAAFTNSGFVLYVSSTQTLTFGRGSPFVTAEGTTSVPADTWQHVALTRSSGTVRGYLNGTKEFEVTDTKTFSLTGWKIGQSWDVAAAQSAGYIDDFRVTVGVARYVGASFTPPTAAFLEAAIPAKPLGEYALDLPYAGEVQLVYLDADAEPLYNDKILRVIPA